MRWTRPSRRSEPWGAWPAEHEDEAAVSLLRANTYTGWPSGAADFVTELEHCLGRRLISQPAGRKKKMVENT